MKKQTITIVIPAYNEASRLAACLEAIAAQTVLPDQVIVVDNNSADNTAKIATGFTFVTLISEKVQGRVFARNAGFNTATSDIIARIDADTIMEPRWVEHILDYYQSNRGAITGTCYFYNVPLRRFSQEVTNAITYHYNYLLAGYYPLWGSNMAFLREDWQKVANKVCAKNGLHEDLDLAYHLHMEQVPIYYDDQLEVGVEMRPNHLQHRERKEYMQQWPNCYKQHGQSSWPLAWVGSKVLQFGHWVPNVLIASKQATARRSSALGRH